MIALALACIAALSGTITLRDGRTVPGERVRGYTAQGVELNTSFEPGEISDRALVPWGEVRSIEGGWGDAEPFRAVADAVWRATGRLARGDAFGAGEAIAPHADTYLDAVGPTTGAIASMLTATRLLGDDRVGAVEAWLAARRSEASGDAFWIDPSTGLCTAIPPVFRPEEAAALLAVETDPGEAPIDGLWALYRVAASLETGEPVEEPDLVARQRADAGVRLVLDMVRARSGAEPSARQGARDALTRRLRAGGPAWEQAWIHLGIGLSMMEEDNARVRDAGASRLVTVIIEHQQTAPGLSPLARDRLIGYFASTGRPEYEAAVRSMDRSALLGLAPWRDERDPGEDEGPAAPDEESP